jgi:hypothetical protein
MCRKIVHLVRFHYTDQPLAGDRQENEIGEQMDGAAGMGHFAPSTETQIYDTCVHFIEVEVPIAMNTARRPQPPYCG